MNIAQLLQVIGITALATLMLALCVLRLRALAQGWLSQRLRPRYLKPAGIRRRDVRQEPNHD
ncbi:cellulose biosynthesis protein BcsF [Pseudomonas sp. PS01300]|uniref:cellulose biosynthesis protein BcsF n=1 Tax=Pseudomonas sp. PS01300 TaxID=2991436 RepID=UPI00249C6A36|nr:cellulose biosynthesis protein BcsF [Pseudomonas sp. PS01300]